MPAVMTCIIYHYMLYTSSLYIPSISFAGSYTSSIICKLLSAALCSAWFHDDFAGAVQSVAKHELWQYKHRVGTDYKEASLQPALPLPGMEDSGSILVTQTWSQLPPKCVEACPDHSSLGATRTGTGQAFHITCFVNSGFICKMGNVI